MKAAVVSLGSKSSKMTAEAMSKYFDSVDNLDIRNIEINFSGDKEEILYRGKPLGKYDCIYAKGSFRYANLLKALTTVIGNSAYMPVRPGAFTICHNKLLTQLEFQNYNLEMPKTYLASTITAARSIFERLNYPIIMKFPQGTQGKGVLFADSYASASSILDALSYLKQPFIIQEYIETGGKDIRAFVVGGKVVASMQRQATVREVRANVHAGGVGEPIELDDEAKRLAVNAARCVGSDICGIDLLIGVKGPLVIEANISPSVQGISKYTTIDVADKIARFLFQKTKEKKTRDMGEGAQEILSSIDQVDKEQTPLITSLDFRGNRVLLPEIITKAADLKDASDYEILVGKDRITIKKFDI